MSASVSDRFSHRSLDWRKGIHLMRKVQNMTIVSQQSIAKNVYEISFKWRLSSSECCKQGSSSNIKINEVAYPLLRRPISICDIDQERNQFTVIYRAEGEGTNLLSQKQAGEQR